MGYGGGGYGGGGYNRGGSGGGFGGGQGGGGRPFEKKDGEGRLFEEGQKKNQNSPDFSGYIVVNGQEIKISGWGKQGQRGFSINLKVKQGNQMMPGQGGQSFSHQPPQQGYGQPPQQAHSGGQQVTHGYGGQYAHNGQPGGFQPPQQPQPPYQAPANARPFPGPQQPQSQGWAPPPGAVQGPGCRRPRAASATASRPRPTSARRRRRRNPTYPFRVV
jgi:hypothetical protein